MSAKSFEIPKRAVWEAWKKVKKNKGSYGVDEQSISEYEENLKSNLYKLWNRLSSGSYIPPAVKAVAIPKKSGGERILGIPTVSDRVAQSVVKDLLEPILDPIFHENSYGYRPNRSALDAVSITRNRCWKYSWVVEFDIKGLFDNISHKLLLKALSYHCDNPWILLYVERWLTAPLDSGNGDVVERIAGTPQGGVVSPILANLFMHYAFDKWVERSFPEIPFCRYADDGVLHCKSQEQAEILLSQLRKRMREVGLELHEEKTKIVFCRMNGRHSTYQLRIIS